MTIKVQTPCLLTCIKELNNPRYMSIGGILSTYSKPHLCSTSTIFSASAFGAIMTILPSHAR